MQASRSAGTLAAVVGNCAPGRKVIEWDND